MKTFRRNLSILSLSVALLLVLSTGASAAVKYGPYELPSTGSKFTSFENKPTRGITAYNNATYVGWEDTINCWVNNNGGGQLTSTSSYSSSQNVAMYYVGSFANDYYGHQVQMQIKTGTFVFHPINVEGVFKGSI